MFSKVVLVACLVAVAVADDYEMVRCSNTTDAVTLTVGSCVSLDNYNVSLASVDGSASNSTLTGKLNMYSDSSCGTETATEDISCTCASSSEYKFVCEGAAFAIPSLLALIAAVAVHML